MRATGHRADLTAFLPPVVALTLPPAMTGHLEMPTQPPSSMKPSQVRGVGNLRMLCVVEQCKFCRRSVAVWHMLGARELCNLGICFVWELWTVCTCLL